MSRLVRLTPPPEAAARLHPPRPSRSATARGGALARPRTPKGLPLSSKGTISGKPTKTGSYRFTVEFKSAKTKAVPAYVTTAKFKIVVSG